MKLLAGVLAAAALAVGLPSAVAGVGPTGRSSNSAQVSGARLWVAVERGAGEQLPRVLAVSPDGSKVFVAGAGPTIAYASATGARVWSDCCPGGQVYALGVSPDGSRVFVTGQTSVGYTTVAYDAATGAELWITPDEGYSPSALAVSPDGSKVFVTGEDEHWGTYFDYGTYAYDAATGARLWVARFNGSGDQSDYAHALAVGPGGRRVFVTGSSINKHGQGEDVTIAYDTATGASVWTKHDPSVGGGPLAVSPDGSRLLLSNYGDRVAALDTVSGATLWVNDSNLNATYDLVVGPGGRRVFVTGLNYNGYRDYATVAYDTATGAQLWRSTYNGPVNRDDEARALAISPDGSQLFVTGKSYGTNYDYATVAYDTTNGDQFWVRRYNGKRATDSIDEARDVGVAPDGSKVFVTGQTGWCDTGCGDYTTIAYSTG